MPKTPEVDVQVKLLFQDAVKQLTNALATAASNIKVGFSTDDKDLKRTVAQVQKFFNEKESLQLFTKDSKVDERELAAFATKAMNMFDKILKSQPALSMQFKTDTGAIKGQIEQFMLLMNNGMTEQAGKVAESMTTLVSSLFSRMNTAISSSGLTEKLKEADAEIEKMLSNAKSNLTEFEQKFKTAKDALQGFELDFGDKAEAERLLTILDGAKEKLDQGSISTQTFAKYVETIGGKLEKLELPPQLQQSFKDIQSTGALVSDADIEKVEKYRKKLEELGGMKLPVSEFTQYAAEAGKMDEAIKAIPKSGKQVSTAFQMLNAALADFQNGKAGIDTVNAAMAKFEESANKAGVSVSDIDTAGVYENLKKHIVEVGEESQRVARDIAFDMGDAIATIQAISKSDGAPPTSLLEILDVTRQLGTGAKMTKEQIDALTSGDLRLSLDTDGIQSQLDGVADALGEVDGAIAGIDPSRTLDPATVIAMQEKFVELSSSMDEVREKAKDIGDEIKKMEQKESLGIITPEEVKQFDALIQKQKELGQQAVSIRGDFQKLHTEITKFKSAVGSIERLHGALGKVNQTMRDMRAFGVPIPDGFLKIVDQASAGLMGMKNVMTTMTNAGKSLDTILAFGNAKKGIAGLAGLAKDAGVNMTQFKAASEKAMQSALAQGKKIVAERGGDLTKIVGDLYTKDIKKYTDSVLAQSKAPQAAKDAFQTGAQRVGTQNAANVALAESGGGRFAKIGGSAATTGILVGVGLIAAGIASFWSLWEKRRNEAYKREMLLNKQLSEMRILAVQQESQLRLAAMQAEFNMEKLRARNREKMAADSLTMTAADLAAQRRLLDIDERRKKSQEDAQVKQKGVQQVRERFEKQMEHWKQQQAARREGLHGDSGIMPGAVGIGAGAGIITATATGLTAAVASSAFAAKLGAAVGLSAGPLGAVIGGAIGAVAGGAVGLAVASLKGDLLPKLRSGQGHTYSNEVSASVRSWGHGFLGMPGIDQAKAAKLQSDLENWDNQIAESVKTKFEELFKSYEGALDVILAGDWEIPDSFKERVEQMNERFKNEFDKLANSMDAKLVAVWEGGVEGVKKRAVKQGNKYTYADEKGNVYVETEERIAKRYVEVRAQVEKARENQKKAFDEFDKWKNEEIRMTNELADKEKELQAAKKARIELEINTEKEFRNKLHDLAKQAAASAGDWKDMSGGSQWAGRQKREFVAYEASQMRIAALQGEDAKREMEVRLEAEKSMFEARVEHEAEYQKARFDLEQKIALDLHQKMVDMAVEYNKLRKNNEIRTFETVLANRKRERDLFQRTLDRVLDRQIVTMDTYGKSPFDIQRDLQLIEIAEKFDRIVTKMEERQATLDTAEKNQEDDAAMKEKHALQQQQNEDQAQFEMKMVEMKHQLELQMMAIRFAMQLEYIKKEVEYRKQMEEAQAKAAAALTDPTTWAKPIENMGWEQMKKTLAQSASLGGGRDQAFIASLEQQKKDLMGKGMSEAEAEKKVKAELTDDDKRALAREIMEGFTAGSQKLESSLQAFFQKEGKISEFNDAVRGLTGDKRVEKLRELAAREDVQQWANTPNVPQQPPQQQTQGQQGQQEQTPELTPEQLKNLQELRKLYADSSTVVEANKSNKERSGWNLFAEKDSAASATRELSTGMASYLKTADLSPEERKKVQGMINNALSKDGDEKTAIEIRDYFKEQIEKAKPGEISGTGAVTSGGPPSQTTPGLTDEQVADDKAKEAMKEGLKEANADISDAMKAAAAAGDAQLAQAMQGNNILADILKQLGINNGDQKASLETLAASYKEGTAQLGKLAMDQATKKGQHQMAQDDLDAKQKRQKMEADDRREARNTASKKEQERAQKLEEERVKLDAERRKRADSFQADMIKTRGESQRREGNINTQFAVDMAGAQTGADWMKAIQKRNRELQYERQSRDLTVQEKRETERAKERGVTESEMAQIQEKYANQRAEMDNSKQIAEAISDRMAASGTYRGLISEDVGGKDSMEGTWERIQAAAFGHVTDPAADATITMDRNMQLQHANLMTFLTTSMPQLIQATQQRAMMPQGRNEYVTNNYNRPAGLAGGANRNY